jgi:hypothetical protein
MEILAARKPTTDFQEFKNLEYRFKREGEQVQASEHTENNNVQVHVGTQILHNKWKEKQVPVQKPKKKKPSKNHRSKIQILHRKEQPDETRMQLSYAILSAATLVSNTQRDSVIMVILTCQPQSSGCEKVEKKPLLFKKNKQQPQPSTLKQKTRTKESAMERNCCYQKRASKRAAQSETTTTLRRETERKMKIMNRSDRR